MISQIHTDNVEAGTQLRSYAVPISRRAEQPVEHQHGRLGGIAIDPGATETSALVATGSSERVKIYRPDRCNKSGQKLSRKE